MDIINFKNCLSKFASGVTIAITNKDNPKGIVISAFTSLSLEPPLILFCLKNNSKLFNDFITEDYFTISILCEDQRDISNHFASSMTRNNWEKIDYAKGEVTSIRVIKDALAYIECKKYATYNGGDHHIFVGEVLSLNSRGDAKPLIYYNSGYHSIV